MRHFNYITVGTILNDLWEELRADGLGEDKLFYVNKHGVRKKRLPIARLTLLRAQKRLDLPHGRRTNGQLQWRVYTPEEAKEVKQKIKKEFNFAQA